MKKVYILLLILICLFIGKVSAYDYKTGDLVLYNDIRFYVISNNNGTLTLVKQDPLLNTDVDYDSLNVYDTEEEIPSEIAYYNYLYIPFYNSSKCYSDEVNLECTNDYNSSIVKKAVDYWVDNNIDTNDLKQDKNGYTKRLITKDDLLDYLGYELNESATNGQLVPTENSIHFFNSWMMNFVADENKIAVISSSVIDYNVYNKAVVSPVILLDSSKVSLLKEYGHNFPIGKYAYKKGETIDINGVQFIVLYDSSKNDDDITLIKKGPIEYDKLIKYMNEYSGDKVTIDSYNGTLDNIKYGKTSFCTGSDTDQSSCSKNYDDSLIKFFIDRWADEVLGSSYLVTDKYGYSARTINMRDLFDSFGCRNQENIFDTVTLDSYVSCGSFPVSIGLENCWTMIPVLDDSTKLYLEYGTSFKIQEENDIQGSVCPIVTIRKSVINNNKEEDSNKVVPVPDTFIKRALTFITLGLFVLILSIVALFVVLKKNNSKSKK